MKLIITDDCLIRLEDVKAVRVHTGSEESVSVYTGEMNHHFTFDTPEKAQNFFNKIKMDLSQA